MSHPYDELWAGLERSVHEAPGQLAPEQRRGAWSVDAAPAFARDLVEKLHDRAADIEDADVAALADQGWSEDQIFEFVISGAVVAGRRTVAAGLAALAEGEQ